MGVGGQRHAPSALPPGKTQYPLCGRPGGHQGQSGQVQKISLPLGFDPRTVQPVVSHYTHCAIPANNMYTATNILCLKPQTKRVSNEITIKFQILLENKYVSLFVKTVIPAIFLNHFCTQQTLDLTDQEG
jgi:hypothetical protein